MARPFRRPTRQITETVHGVDVAYDVPDNTPVIRLPFNLDAALRRGLFALAIGMTAVAIVWGTVAIGSMLTLLAPPWAAYLVAGVFDAGWAACLVAEWLLRYDSRRAEIPMRVGVALLAVSMAAIITHGALAGPWGWVIGIIGALVSAAAKGVWAVGMHTIRIKLEPKYEAYLNARRQKAGTEMALALGERDRLLVEDSAVKLRLALETQRPAAPVVVQEPDEAASAPTPLPIPSFWRRFDKCAAAESLDRHLDRANCDGVSPRGGVQYYADGRSSPSDRQRPLLVDSPSERRALLCGAEFLVALGIELCSAEIKSRTKTC